MIEADNENKMKVDIENERDRLAKNHDTDFIRKFLGYCFVTQANCFVTQANWKEKGIRGRNLSRTYRSDKFENLVNKLAETLVKVEGEKLAQILEENSSSLNINKYGHGNVLRKK